MLKSRYSAFGNSFNSFKVFVILRCRTNAYKGNKKSTNYTMRVDRGYDEDEVRKKENEVNAMTKIPSNTRLVLLMKMGGEQEHKEYEDLDQEMERLNTILDTIENLTDCSL